VDKHDARLTRPYSTIDACAIRLGKIVLQSLDIDQLLSSDGCELKHVVTVNSEIFVYAHENKELETILKHSVNTIDGRVLQFLCSLLYEGVALQKLSGSDFIYDLAERAARHGERIFLLGAEAHSNRGAIDALVARFPHLVIDGYSPPFCSSILQPEWNEAIHRRIAGFCPTHLVVCFGPPKQEMWISQHADRLFKIGVRCAYGLGGTLDFVSGRKRRAPKWIQRVGAEWLFRLLSEPRQRIGRTAKMFKMFHFALRYRHFEFRHLKSNKPVEHAAGKSQMW
jgi:N-acetylglucosaminyldiphosphoundecaprenol N-acetyl-beta-D-mannosaminyltransferase